MFNDYVFPMDDEIRELLETMEDQADPETGEIPEALVAEFEAIEAKREEKLADLVVQRKEVLAFLAALKEARQEFSARIARHERHADRLAQLLVDLCPDHQKFSDPKGRFGTTSFRESVSVEVTCDPEELPDEFIRWKVEPKKTDLKKCALEGDERLSGKVKINRRWTPVVR